MEKKGTSLFLLSVLLLQCSGCAAVTAIRQPGEKNLAVLNRGVTRENVVAYLGAPVSTKKEEEKTVELYQFRQGYSGGNKATRATMHLILDVFTFFIWELIGWPAEAVFDGHDMTVKVVYDEKDQVEDFNILKQ